MDKDELFQVESVRVLRHQFEASESLKNRLKHLIDPEFIAKESLKIYSHGHASYRLPQRGLYSPSEMDEINLKFNQEVALMTKLSRSFAARKDRIQIASDELRPIKYAKADEGKMRIIMFPKDAQQYMDVANTFDALGEPTEIRNQPSLYNLFYVELATSSLHRNRAHLREAREDLEMSRRLYSVSPLQIDQKDILIKTSLYRDDDVLLPEVG